jgi:hypothetical protein
VGLFQDDGPVHQCSQYIFGVRLVVKVIAIVLVKVVVLVVVVAVLE